MSIVASQIPWWLDRVAVPFIFTLFGASLGFAAGRLKDWLDARNVKQGFLKAIRAELAALQNHLEGTLKDATEVRDLLQKGQRRVLHFAGAFLTGVYDSQLSKLRDVSDPLILEIIRFYDLLSNLERVKTRATEVSYDLTALAVSKESLEKEQPIFKNYVSSLDEVLRRIKQLIPLATGLIAKLPK